MATSAPRVLVVDDDAGIRQMLSIALGQRGIDAVLSDGRDLDALGTAFDAVLIDLRLGDRTALDVLDELPGLRHRPIVVMTAAHERLSELAGLPGVTVLSKPFDLVSLDETLDAALGLDA